MIQRISYRAAFALALLLPVAACDNGALGTEAGATTEVVLNQGSVASSEALASMSAQAAGSAGPMGLSMVKSIEVTITGVQAVLKGEDDDDDKKEGEDSDSVVTLKVEQPTKIDLLKLPAEPNVGIKLARGTLPLGRYSNIRLVISEANITFKEDVMTKETTYTKDKAYPLSIGGDDDERMVKIPAANFEVSAQTGSTITLTFDASQSVKKIIVNQNRIKMPPVLSARHGKKK